MKLKIIIVIVILTIVGTCVWMGNRTSFAKKWNQHIEQLNAYCLKGRMELRKGQEYQDYDLEVYYQKENEQYKVILNDLTLNQSQSIVRNKDGVFVMTPQLNQIFKFQGSWPNNTQKPYLIQTIDKLLKDANITKDKKETIAECDVVYPSHKNYKHQKMIFDEQARIKSLVITNENNEKELQINFERCEWNPKLDQSTFKIPETFDVKTSAFPQEQLPLYPMEVFGAKLDDVSYVDTVDGQKVMMNYVGDKSFTLVQSAVIPSETTKMVFMPGALQEQYDLFGVEELFQFSAYYHGIEFRIYSEELTTSEMIKILNSVQGVGMK